MSVIEWILYFIVILFNVHSSLSQNISLLDTYQIDCKNQSLMAGHIIKTTNSSVFVYVYINAFLTFNLIYFFNSFKLA